LWVLPFIIDSKFKFKTNPLNWLARWKIFDNLRRSLIPVAFTALFVMGWTILDDAWFWNTFITAMLISPPVLFSLWGIFKKPEEITWKRHFNNAFRNTAKNVTHTLFFILCLPYEAFISMHAIIVTLWRLLVTHKKLLEWNPFGLLSFKSVTIGKAYEKMWVTPLLSVLVSAYLFIASWVNLLMALPYLISWVISPAIIWLLNQPVAKPKIKELSNRQRGNLRVLSRKTWAYFESLVGQDSNWLPPDNIQLQPREIVADRTSPTNIGLMLLANLTAYDFGYLTLTGFLDRTSQSLQTLGKMERLYGHFFNWYNTSTLEPLHPRYISTVDSGNLGGHLLTLRQGILGLIKSTLLPQQYVEGILDTLRIVLKQMPISKQENRDFFNAASDVLLKSHHPEMLLTSLSEFRTMYIEKFNASVGQEHAEWLIWHQKLLQQLERLTDEINAFYPWLSEKTPDHLKELANQYYSLTLEQWSSVYTLSLPAVEDESDRIWLEQFREHILNTAAKARNLISSMQHMANQCRDYADMEYEFLYDDSQRLLSIGYNAEEHKRDLSFYDLLASEARLTVFLAIAQGKIPQESWFALGRRLTTVGNSPTLISWTGSMFEYLMPMLFMPTFINTLLDETMIGCIKKQIEYGKLLNIPWGISESCYNVVDSNFIYQYKAFGVPDLGFKRGLGQDMVVAPYASVMALMVDPSEAYKNIERLKKSGYEGLYGLYEAVDFTPSRLAKGKNEEIIPTFMVHHEGMSFLSLAFVLLDQPMQKRFEKDPEFQTAMLLLQERIPRVSGFYQGSSEVDFKKSESVPVTFNVYNTPDTDNPAAKILSNGNLHTMITNAGGGYVHWKGIALNRWREDGTQDHYGSFLYIRNLETGEFWSNTYQPTLKTPDFYSVDFSYGKADFHRVDYRIETHTEMIISPEDDVEIRRVKITNQSNNSILLELTSYNEVVLANQASDIHHSAFSNLFVQTEIIPQHASIVCTRRPRSKEENPPWMFYSMKVSKGDARKISFETNRMEFIGRGRSLAHPKVMEGKNDLPGTSGNVLDPVVAIRKILRVEPYKTVVVDMIHGIAGSKDAMQKQMIRYQDVHIRNRAFELSWTHNQVILHQINSSVEESQMFSRLTSSILFNNKDFRASEHILAQNTHGQSSLWGYSISGDRPIILLKVSHISNIKIVKQLIQAITYWDIKGLLVDLVILNEDATSYRQELQSEIQGLMAERFGSRENLNDRRIFLRPADQVPAEDQILLQSVARIVISDKNGGLEEQLSRKSSSRLKISKFKQTSTRDYPPEQMPLPDGLIFFNQYGGFSSNGHEYIVDCHQNNNTPLPWVNIIANRQMATMVSESGSGYTWYENAYGFRLTPWSNDPVNDPASEAFYIRDEETGKFWSLTPRPAGGTSNYICAHGFGYTRFEHVDNGIQTELLIFIDPDESVKFTTIKIKNRSKYQRKITLTGYVEWVLATIKSQSQMHIVTETDAETKAIIARNSYNTEFSGRIAFFDTDEEVSSFTCDRKEFIGRNSNLSMPKAMTKERLSNTIGAGLDPCTALQVEISLQPEEEYQTVFRLGAAKNREQAVELIVRTKGVRYAESAKKRVDRYWENTLHTVKINTPDQALNLLANGWLLYQTLSSRIWGRSGFYQSGGAYGFRDQLQDVMSLLYSSPGIARKQILLSSSRQFTAGDVQHWWHPPVGRGVRTMCSDDYLWLPFVTAKFISVTGDFSILQEQEHFLEGRLLNEGEESYYDMPVISNVKTTLYEHCKLAIRHGFRFGERGLPLIGSGDWNDGMNLIGIKGKGESVWLAFFLYDVLQQFIPIARYMQDDDFAVECENIASQLKMDIHDHTWDGQWYRRAYFDDGTPLGSAENEECSIDSISQSWSLLSGAGEQMRSESGLQHAYQYLVDKEKGLIKLLHPPFNKSILDPGYIKGYVPGVRENGGQYTHAAIWLIMAFAKLGDKKRVWELLSMINPVNHGKHAEDVSVYKAEPYVMAADVYGVEPHTGRGGWTWYTGSASWMYLLILEHFIGIRKQGDQLHFLPVVPEEWKGFSVVYLHFNTHYHIRFEASAGQKDVSITHNGLEITGDVLALIDDGKVHEVIVRYPVNQNG
jgi:cyclic beta-1,2-glucan synthetase